MKIQRATTSARKSNQIGQEKLASHKNTDLLTIKLNLLNPTFVKNTDLLTIKLNLLNPTFVAA